MSGSKEARGSKGAPEEHGVEAGGDGEAFLVEHVVHPVREARPRVGVRGRRHLAALEAHHALFLEVVTEDAHLRSIARAGRVRVSRPAAGRARSAGSRDTAAPARARGKARTVLVPLGLYAIQMKRSVPTPKSSVPSTAARGGVSLVSPGGRARRGHAVAAPEPRRLLG